MVEKKFQLKHQNPSYEGVTKKRQKVQREKKLERKN
jgi:hypothetical protein